MSTINPLLIFMFVDPILDFAFAVLIVNFSRNHFAVVVRMCGVASKSVRTLITLKSNVGRNPRNVTTETDLVEFPAASKYHRMSTGHIVQTAQRIAA